MRWLVAVVGIFLLNYFLPAGTARFDNAVLEGKVASAEEVQRLLKA